MPSCTSLADPTCRDVGTFSGLPVATGAGGGSSMNRLRITCLGCGRNWPLLLAPSPYLELVLATQPCPACEGYTLSCPQAGEDLLRPRPEERERGRPSAHASPGPDI
jgi:hypothetical protein